MGTTLRSRDRRCTGVCVTVILRHDGRANGEYYCRRRQMPAGSSTKGKDREWIEQLLLFIAEPTEKVFAIKTHTGPDSCRCVWIQSHTKRSQQLWILLRGNIQTGSVPHRKPRCSYLAATLMM